MPSGLARDPRADLRTSFDTPGYARVQPSAKEIPYDYVARFTLDGVLGRRHQDVINISIEGAFIATAIAYGFLPKISPLDAIEGTVAEPEPDPEPNPNPGATGATFVETVSFPSLGELVAELLARQLTDAVKSSFGLDKNKVRTHISDFISLLLRHASGIDFKYSIVDSGTGRELQNQPIHNLAGLGSADGARPFRPFPKPITFLPRSTIRIEIEEASQGPLYAGGELQIVLHGYKLLGAGL